jgi:hypothetical protein
LGVDLFLEIGYSPGFVLLEFILYGVNIRLVNNMTNLNFKKKKGDYFED